MTQTVQKIKKGARVVWTDARDDSEHRGEVVKVWRNGRAQVYTENFETISIELTRLKVASRQTELIPLDEDGDIDMNADLLLPPNNLPPNSLPPNNLPPNSLPPNNLPPNSLPPNKLGHWLEIKKVRGQIYKYERWREEIEVNGVKQIVKRSRYLEKVISDRNSKI